MSDSFTEIASKLRSRPTTNVPGLPLMTNGLDITQLCIQRQYVQTQATEYFQELAILTAIKEIQSFVNEENPTKKKAKDVSKIVDLSDISNTAGQRTILADGWTAQLEVAGFTVGYADPNLTISLT